MTSPEVIRIHNLYKSFGKNNVLNDFSVSLHRGENLAVLGKSGSGKSVLIKCIIGLMAPDKGQINVLGFEVPELKQSALDQLRVKVGFLFQSNALYDSMTVRENLEFPLRRHRFSKTKKQVDAMVHEALDAVGLSHTAEMMPSELSGGMRKRVALARTLILKPEIILYDEPTTGLDPITGGEISRLMVSVQQQYNTSSMVISHDLNCVSLVANRVVLLLDGKCYAEGTLAELSESNDIRVREFFHPIHGKERFK